MGADGARSETLARPERDPRAGARLSRTTRSMISRGGSPKGWRRISTMQIEDSGDSNWDLASTVRTSATDRGSAASEQSACLPRRCSYMPVTRSPVTDTLLYERRVGAVLVLTRQASARARARVGRGMDGLDASGVPGPNVFGSVAHWARAPTTGPRVRLQAVPRTAASWLANRNRRGGFHYTAERALAANRTPRPSPTRSPIGSMLSRPDLR